MKCNARRCDVNRAPADLRMGDAESTRKNGSQKKEAGTNRCPLYLITARLDSRRSIRGLQLHRLPYTICASVLLRLAFALAARFAPGLGPVAFGGT